MDPTTARQYALAAASHAFGKANGIQPPATDSSRSHGKTLSTTEHSEQLSRNPSIRFTGPPANVTGRPNVIRRKAVAGSNSVETSVDEGHSHGLPSQKPPTEKVQDPLTALPQVDESSRLEEELASEPSSYRKLRKAKPMFSPRKSSTAMFTDRKMGTNANQGPSISNNRTSLDTRSGEEPTRQMPETSRYTRLGYSYESSDHSEIQEAAMQMAKDQYARQLEQQRSVEKTSFLEAPPARRPHKPFHKSFRNNSYGNAIASPNQPVNRLVESKSLGTKARDMSTAIKNKLKRVFRRSSDLPETLPVQQVDSKRAHFHEYIPEIQPAFQREYDNVPAPDTDLLSRVGSREASVRMTPLHGGPRSRAGSIRSTHSNDIASNVSSRFTSWSQMSTATDTIGTGRTIDKKRLSIIPEVGGPNQPSSLTEQDDPVFSTPTIATAGGRRLTSIIDTKRLYSALIKRIEENKVAARLEEGEAVVGHGYGGINFPPPRNTSASTQRTAGTIRVVSQDSQNKGPSSLEVGESSSRKISPVPGNRIDEFFASRRANRNSRPLTIEMITEATGMTPQQIADHNEGVRPVSKQQLRDVRSSFFPHTSEVNAFKASPYKQAVGEGTGASNLPNDHNRDVAKVTHRSGSGISLTNAYLRSTSNKISNPFDSPISPVSSITSGEPGSAVFITTRSTNPKIGSSPITELNSSSTNSSQEWKKWMSSEVSNLEKQATERIKINEAYSSPKVGHQRESAQIHGDDVQVGSGHPSSAIFKQPLAGMHRDTRSKPGLLRTNSEQMVDRFPLIDRPAVMRNASDQAPLLLNHRSSVPTLMISDVDSERNLADPVFNGRSTALSMVSQISLHPTASTPKTPYLPSNDVEGNASPPFENTDSLDRRSQRTRSMAHLRSRHSPERAYRLQRMRGSNPGLGEAFDRRLGSADPSQQNDQALGENTRRPSQEMEHKIHRAGPSDPIGTNDQAAGREQMLDIFLTSRRRNMRISEESGTDPAFL